jgi:hypothetical protein
LIEQPFYHSEKDPALEKLIAEVAYCDECEKPTWSLVYFTGTKAVRPLEFHPGYGEMNARLGQAEIRDHGVPGDFEVRCMICDHIKTGEIRDVVQAAVDRTVMNGL